MTDLIKSTSVEALVLKRDAIIAHLSAAVDAVQTASKISKSITIDGDRGVHIPVVTVRFSRGTDLRIDGEVTLDRIIADVDQSMWKSLLRGTQLDTLMPERVKKELTEQLQTKPPTFDVPTITATFAGLMESRQDLVEESVVDLFRSLNWDRKTNNPVAFGDRIIFSIASWMSFLGCEQINDIVRVCCVVAGEPTPDHSCSASSWMVDEDGRPVHYEGQLPCVWERQWFRLKVHKNRSAHLTWTDTAVRDRLNEIIAARYPGCLPAGKK